MIDKYKNAIQYLFWIKRRDFIGLPNDFKSSGPMKMPFSTFCCEKLLPVCFWFNQSWTAQMFAFQPGATYVKQ